MLRDLLIWMAGQTFGVPRANCHAQGIVLDWEDETFEEHIIAEGERGAVVRDSHSVMEVMGHGEMPPDGPILPTIELPFQEGIRDASADVGPLSASSHVGQSPLGGRAFAPPIFALSQPTDLQLPRAK